jgi:tetratricopeptide (TPR) repeat protein
MPGTRETCDGNAISREALAAELDRICESAAFRHSLRHQRFLRHLIDCKIARRHASLREIALGVEFFHRPASSYDPKSDAVVRVEAGRLRQRLDRYYHAEGIAAPLEISLDRGSYMPVFRIRAPAAAAIGAQPSIAVLPLAPATPNAHDRQLAAGITDEIVETLSRLPRLRVLRPDPSTAAELTASSSDALGALKIAWIVRARWSDARPAVLAIEVVAAGNGDSVLVRRIDPSADDALALHQRVRTELLHHLLPLLAMRYGAEVFAPSSLRFAAPTQELAAFDIYQRARYLLKQRDQAVLHTAIEHLETAVRVDPRFSAAWAELATAYVRRRQLVFDAAQRDPGPAKRAAQRAIELDPDAGSAYATLAGLAYVSDFDWTTAAALFERALVASPRDATVRCAFATFLMYSARFEDSLREYDVMQALDPLDAAIRCHKGALYFYWRRYDRAETVLAQAIELCPRDVYAHLLLADSHAQSGRLDENLRASQRLVEIAPSYANSHVYLARALQMLGREKEALATIAGARERFGRGAITEYEEAMLDVARGDVERTLERLEQHALRKANGAHCMVVDPTFAILHDDPRWRSMLARVGLPDLVSSGRVARADRGSDTPG